jgi:NAD(P)-dependent dehydrogenase (short-subunit alcohol dehydrogenase family)
MSVNLKGAYLCGKFAFEDMKKRRWGRMIHISSLWAYQPATSVLYGRVCTRAEF